MNEAFVVIDLETTDREDVRFCAEKELVRRQEERAAARRRDAAEDTVPG